MALQQQKNQLNQQDQRRQVMVQALFMAVGTMTSRILGLLRESLFAALFSRTITDAWYVAFRLPNIFRRLLGEGSLSVSFIPVFVEAHAKGEGTDRAHRLVNGFYTLFFLLLSTITALGILFPEPLLNVFLDEAYHLVPGKFDLTVMMARVMFIYIFLVCTYAYFMAILNALGKFGLAALAPTFFNVCMVLSTLIPSRYTQWEGQALAWGVVVGGLVQAGVLVPSLRRLGYWPKLTLQFSSPDVWKVLRNMGPGLIGMGLLQFTTLINMRFASELGEGPISFINLADRLLELPLSLVSVSLGSALLPTLARMWTHGQRDEMSSTSNYYMRVNLYVCVPAAIGLFVLAEPIVELLFQRGKFTVAESLATAGVVKVYSFLVISNSLVRVFVPTYYAVKNTWLPAVVSTICLVVHLGLAPVLMKHYGLYGLNSSTVVSSTLNFLMLAVCYRFLIGPFGWFRVLRGLSCFLLAGLVMAGSLQVYGPLRAVVGNGFFAKVLALVISISIGAGVYAVISWVFKFEEFRVTSETLIAKLRRK